MNRYKRHIKETLEREQVWKNATNELSSALKTVHTVETTVETTAILECSKDEAPL